MYYYIGLLEELPPLAISSVILTARSAGFGAGHMALIYQLPLATRSAMQHQSALQNAIQPAFMSFGFIAVSPRPVQGRIVRQLYASSMGRSNAGFW